MSPDQPDSESYHGYSVDDEDQPQGDGDSLVDDRGLAEPLDEGYSPPEKWSAAQGYGNTPLEEAQGESLDQRVDQEIAEPDPYEVADEEAARGDLAAMVAEDSSEGEAVQADVEAAEGERAGRLVAADEGVGPTPRRTSSPRTWASTAPRPARRRPPARGRRPRPAVSNDPRGAPDRRSGALASSGRPGLHPKVGLLPACPAGLRSLHELT